MKNILLPLLLLASTCSPRAQKTDNDELIKKAESQLRQKTSTVSSILSSPEFLPVHDETSFRQLIKSYCNSDPVSITTAEEPGKKIIVTGTITDHDGKPVSDALVYLYQTDAKGWYAAGSPHVGGNEGDMRQARLFGYVKTDQQGRFELHTIKPSGYPQSDLPAHIHVHVWAAGFRDFVNEFLFDDDERLIADIREQSIRNRFMISKPEKADPPFVQKFSYRIVLVK